MIEFVYLIWSQARISYTLVGLEKTKAIFYFDFSFGCYKDTIEISAKEYEVGVVIDYDLSKKKTVNFIISITSQF